MEENLSSITITIEVINHTAIFIDPTEKLGTEAALPFPECSAASSHIWKGRDNECESSLSLFFESAVEPWRS